MGIFTRKQMSGNQPMFSEISFSERTQIRVQICMRKIPTAGVGGESEPHFCNSGLILLIMDLLLRTDNLCSI